MHNNKNSEFNTRDVNNSNTDYSNSIVVGGGAPYNNSTRRSNPLLSKETSKERSNQDDTVTQNYSNINDKSDRAPNLIDAYR